MLSTYLKILASQDVSKKRPNMMIYELVKVLAFYIYNDKKYIEEFKAISNNEIFKLHIVVAINELKLRGFIYNVDKEGIPIWNPRMNSHIFSFIDNSENLVSEFIKVWGNRQRFMEGRLWSTMDAKKITVALSNYKRSNDTSDETIIEATKAYLSTFKEESNGYPGLSNAHNFIANLLINYVQAPMKIMPTIQNKDSYFNDM